MNYGRRLLIAVDQLANAIAGGWPDETISSRAWRKRHSGLGWGVARRLIDGLFFWEPGHCQKAWEAEINRTQAPGATR